MINVRYFMYYESVYFMLLLKEVVCIMPYEVFSPCQKEGRNDVFYYMSKLANWHGHECIEVKDMDSDMARQHSRQMLQAPTHTSKVKESNKNQQFKFM